MSSFGPWELEYEECFGHKPSVKRLISGISKTDKQDYLISSRTSELTLISYASLISLQKELGFFLRNNKVMVVLDEAHKAKNSSGGVIAQAVLELAKYSSARVVLLVRLHQMVTRTYIICSNSFGQRKTLLDLK